MPRGGDCTLPELYLLEMLLPRKPILYLCLQKMRMGFAW